MDIGDIGPQPPAQEQFAVPGWRPADGLMPREEEMLKAAARGLVDDGPGPFDLAGMKAWTEERTVRAAVLRHLLIDDEWLVDTKGVRLRGARIHGHLDLEAATLRCPLSLQSCYFDSVQPPALGFAKVSLLELKGCHLAGLVGKSVVVSKDLDLSDSTFTGLIDLSAADITSDLKLSNARLHGKDEDGNALVADSVKVGGRAMLDGGFTADGCVRMPGADITGRLRFRGATLKGKDNHGSALLADGMKAGGGMELGESCTTEGALRLVGADIAGDLKMSGAHLHGKDDEGNALVANGIRVSGDIIFDKSSRSSDAVGSTADGGLSFRSAHVGGSLQLRPEKLAGKKALDLEGARIAHDLEWKPVQQISGQVILEDTEVGLLKDNLAKDPNGYWPSVHPGPLLRLNGFTYRGFGGEPCTVDDRLRWIGSLGKAKQVKDSTGTEDSALTGTEDRELTGTEDRELTGTRYFASQPYEQLAAVYRQAGQDTEARKVAIARRADLRKYGDLKWHRRIGNWLLDKTIKYGYQTWRAGLALAVVFVAFWALAYFAQQHHLMEPVGSFHGPAPSATQCTGSYPCFSPLGYTVDTVIPLINVHQATYWGPNASAPWGWAWVAGTAIATGLGWALATLLVAGYTGLVRQE